MRRIFILNNLFRVARIRAVALSRVAVSKFRKFLIKISKIFLENFENFFTQKNLSFFAEEKIFTLIITQISFEFL